MTTYRLRPHFNQHQPGIVTGYQIMTQPQRHQRRRTRGYKLPPGTICVTRPSKFGNPWSLKEVGSRDAAINAFREFLATMLKYTNPNWLEELRGHSLACYCKLCPKHADGKPLTEHCPDCTPCHVDVIAAVLYGEPK